MKILLFPVFLSLLVAGILGMSKAPSPQGGSKEVIIFKSPPFLGKAVFPHLEHVDDLDIECTTCHHEAHAPKLKTPHPQFFKDFWIDCSTCHHPEKAGDTKIRPCTRCHHRAPSNITDERLSSKVVIHKVCWKCHHIKTGADAAKNCGFCHKKDGKGKK